MSPESTMLDAATEAPSVASSPITVTLSPTARSEAEPSTDAV